MTLRSLGHYYLDNNVQMKMAKYFKTCIFYDIPFVYKMFYTCNCWSSKDRRIDWEFRKWNFHKTLSIPTLFIFKRYRYKSAYCDSYKMYTKYYLNV